MRPIVVHRRHSLGLTDARRLIETTAERLRAEHGGAFQWDGDTLRFRRTGATGRVAVTNDDVEVRVDIGLLLLPLHTRIAREIRAFLDEKFGAAVTPKRSSRSGGASRSKQPKSP
jgi:putative polyhydroxyalkanoate system protein